MHEHIGKTFRLREPQGDVYDIVQVVAVVRSEEIDEPVIQPVDHGKTMLARAEAFNALYTTEGVEQIERVEPEDGRYGGWSEVAGTEYREKHGGKPGPPNGYADLLHDDTESEVENV